eukprot:TRINITY_DN17247_c0_g3_i2.p1 TRINITY_DN17247_c0_g3~~TRINITY_DN17247_c0_g3_i2.p1  ORF type:complete len:178 (-),score=41.46 TRINITY_DN17247_c0_g3_i2:64-597(-)
MIYHQSFTNVVATSPDVNITSVSNDYSGSANQITINFGSTPVVPRMTARFYVTYTAPNLAQSITSSTDELFWTVDNTKNGLDFFNVTTQFVIPSNLSPSSITSNFNDIKITRDPLTNNLLVTRFTPLVPSGSSWSANAKYPTLANGECRKNSRSFYAVVIAVPIVGVLLLGVCCRSA